MSLALAILIIAAGAHLRQGYAIQIYGMQRRTALSRVMQVFPNLVQKYSKTVTQANSQCIDDATAPILALGFSGTTM